MLSEAKWYQDVRAKRSKMLLSRSNQLLYEFSFWNEVVPRDGPNVYELRTYFLKVNYICMMSLIASLSSPLVIF